MVELSFEVEVYLPALAYGGALPLERKYVAQLCHVLDFLFGFYSCVVSFLDFFGKNRLTAVFTADARGRPVKTSGRRLGSSPSRASAGAQWFSLRTVLSLYLVLSPLSGER